MKRIEDVGPPPPAIREYQLENGRKLMITLTDEGMVVDLWVDDRVVASYYRFIEEMIPTDAGEEG